jgi:ribosomal protein S18 acetylase RimI-like enzyme
VSVRKASLPDNTTSIQSLLKYIDLSIYPGPTDIENPDDQWFVYKENSEIVGCVAARRSRGEIRHVVVLPDHQREGVGSKLVKLGIEFLKSIGYSRIWAQIRVNNKESQAFFESLGFVRKSRLVTSPKDPQVKLYKYELKCARELYYHV